MIESIAYDPTLNGTTTPRWERLGPEEADRLLRLNTRNRRVSPNRVAYWIGVIERGEWMLIPEAIVVCTDGVIENGQHRLNAIRKAGTPVWALVWRDAPIGTQRGMDRGRGRSYGDDLGIRGEHNPQTLAAAVGILSNWERTGVVRRPIEAASPFQRDITLARNPDIRQAIKNSSGLARGFKVVAPSFAAVLRLLFEYAQPLEDVEEFFTSTISGVGLEENSPILSLRRQLDLFSKARDRPDPYVYSAIIIKAFNAYVDGRPIRVLTFKSGGANPERFPTIRGLENPERLEIKREIARIAYEGGAVEDSSVVLVEEIVTSARRVRETGSPNNMTRRIVELADRLDEI